MGAGDNNARGKKHGGVVAEVVEGADLIRAAAQLVSKVRVEEKLGEIRSIIDTI